MTYTAWLRSLGPDRLAELLTLRPDAAGRPAPADLDELAARLTTSRSVEATLDQLDTFALQVAEILAALGGVPPARLHQLFGASEALDVAVSELTRRGLVWESGPPPEGTLRPAAGLLACWTNPLNLGRGLRNLLGSMPPDQLDLVVRTLGVQRQPSRKKAHDAIAAQLTAERIVALAAQAPPQVTKLLDATTWDSPNVILDVEMALALSWGRARMDRSGVVWAVGHALLLPVAWGVLQMPREVGLALRGPNWRPTLRMDRPAVATADVDLGSVERESAAVSSATLDAVTSVVDTLAAAPARPLRTGGLGVREIRRLTKAAGADERTMTLALEAARAAGLITVTSAGILPTPEYDQWRSQSPAARLVALLDAWWNLDGPVSERSSPHDDKPLPPLFHAPPRPEVRRLRHKLLDRAAKLPAGNGIASLPSLLADVSWQLPRAYPVMDLDTHAEACWWEAGAFGLVAHGAVTAFGRALLGGDSDEIATTARGLVPPATSRATFQADLTATVSGTPDAALADLLDTGADRETRGSAHVWRFTAASVRRFLDTGGQSENLLADLADVANQPLPQPVEYLVRDVARRHGEVTVRPVACCVVSADEPLLAEIAAHRSLRGLGLHVLAPTVIASSKPVADTVGALRAAGYAPVRLTPAGHAVVERVSPRRAAGSPSTGHEVVDIASWRPARRTVPEPAQTDPAELAQALLGSDPAEPSDSESLTLRRLLDVRTGLAQHELRVLSHAIDHQQDVHIDYVDQNGRRTSRVISDIALFGTVVEAWCHLRRAQRMFSLSGIESVSPAP